MSPCAHRRGNTTLAVVTSSGLDVLLDTEVLDPLGELRAVVAGRRTFTRHTWSGQIDYRRAGTITARPAGSRPRQDVHAEHRCTGGDG